MKSFLRGMAGAAVVIVVVAISLLAYHAYQDHQSVHLVVGVLNQILTKHADLLK